MSHWTMVLVLRDWRSEWKEIQIESLPFRWIEPIREESPSAFPGAPLNSTEPIQQRVYELVEIDESKSRAYYLEHAS